MHYELATFIIKVREAKLKIVLNRLRLNKNSKNEVEKMGSCRLDCEFPLFFMINALRARKYEGVFRNSSRICRK